MTKDGVAAGHFEYDANGNRTLAYGIAAGYDDQDQLSSFGGVQYSYTANGELQQVAGSAGTTGYTYDVFGNLTHVDLPNGAKLDYLVDGRNRRIGKKVNGALAQSFLYQDQLKPAAELDAQGNVVSRFVYAGKANVPEYMDKGGVAYRIIGDQLGSVRLVVNSATGQIVQRIDYDEWGNVQGDSNPGFQPFGYAGGLYDRDTGLVRFGARDYDARSGRWTAKDPIGFGGGDTSLYNYVGGNPVSRMDPMGLYCFTPAQISAIAGGVGGGVGGAISGAIAGPEIGMPIAGAIGGGVSGAGAGFGAGAAAGKVGGAAAGAVAGAPGGLPGMVAGAIGGEATDSLGGGAVAGAVGGGIGGFGSYAGAIGGSIGGLIGGALEKYLTSHNDCQCSSGH